MKCEISGKEYEYLDKHHIRSKCYGGKDNEMNICYVRPDIHRLIHRGELILEGKYDTTSGKRVVWRLKGEPSITGVEDPPCYTY